MVPFIVRYGWCFLIIFIFFFFIVYYRTKSKTYPKQSNDCPIESTEHPTQSLIEQPIQYKRKDFYLDYSSINNIINYSN